MYFQSVLRQGFRHTVHSACTALLILLFIYAALSKLLNLELFRGQLYNQSFSHDLADLLLWGLPLSELLTCGLLLFPLSRRLGLLLSLVLMTVFTLYIILVLLGYWERVPCSCGGILEHLNWTQHLYFNLFFLLLAMAGLAFGPEPEP